MYSVYMLTTLCSCHCAAHGVQLLGMKGAVHSLAPATDFKMDVTWTAAKGHPA